MAVNTLCLLFFCFSIPTISAALSTTSLSETDPLSRNAFRIFNALHSSMRQWGSSLNYNGMSFFPALVPKGTEFYHGRGTYETVTGMEWLPFEPEHAQLFANHGPSRRRPLGDENWPPKDGNRSSRFRAGRQQPLEFEKPDDGPETRQFGFLHTYVTKRDLQLLYIDGMSAGKTSNGTLDSQDYVVLNSTERHSGFWDYERAKEMCAIASLDWKGRVDGFIRMEAGFEIILCDFTRSVDVRRITRAGGLCSDFRGCKDAGPETAYSANFAYLRAVSDRYHGVGGNRVRINYDQFITAYSHDIDLFEFSNRAPRLQDAPANVLSAIRSELNNLVLAKPNPFTKESIDWQAITDMIIAHYSARLQYLGSDKILSNNATFLHELDLLLSSFIDYETRSLKAEIERCSTHFLPLSVTSSLASRTTSFVSAHICKTLFSLTTSLTLDHRTKTLNTLLKDLSWTTWKQCTGCGWDEVCLVPIWPYGTEADWVKPSCVNATVLSTKRGYWGGHGGPGGGRPGGERIGQGPPGKGHPLPGMTGFKG
jgi:hypothetical protein